MIGAGVLTEHEDRIRLFEILQPHGALTNTNRFRERDTARLVAHVRTIGQIVGTESPHEELIQKCSFVAGAPRSVKQSFVRAIKGVQFFTDQAEGIVPRDWFVVIGGGVVAHGVNQPPLALEKVRIFPSQFGHRMFCKKFRTNGLLCGFPGDRLHAVLAKLE